MRNFFFDDAKSAHSSGFTLAELLIALAILGVIAIFAIPKLLTSYQNSQNKARLKEAISVINAPVYEYCLRNPSHNLTEMVTAIQSRINAARSCVNEADCGFAANTFPATDGRSNARWFMLHSGVYLQIGTGSLVDINLDANGPDGPNLYGQDRLRAYAGFPGNASLGTYGVQRACVVEGTAVINTVTDASERQANLDLYREFFTN